MTHEAILKDLKNKVYHPVYFLHGEEPYYIDMISDYIGENVLSDSEKEFNQIILYGKETDPLTLISYAKRYPMMANYQVVILKEAQALKGIEKLLSYIENPLKSTILVICHKYKKIDKRKSFAKALIKKALVFESSRLYENKIPDWVSGYVSGKSYTIHPRAALLIAEYLGNDLSKVANELDKLIINLPTGTEIMEQHIEENIGISKDYNVFELQNAIGKKDMLKVNRIAKYFSENPKNNPLAIILASLYSYFAKVLTYHTLTDRSRKNAASAMQVHMFFVSNYEKAAKIYAPQKIFQIFSYLREYDLKSKGVNNISTGEAGLLKELLFKILH